MALPTLQNSKLCSMISNSRKQRNLLCAWKNIKQKASHLNQAAAGAKASDNEDEDSDDDDDDENDDDKRRR